MMGDSNLPFPKLNVLITGGTLGLGKAIGMEFASLGATTYLTHHWGSADEDELRAEFTARGAAKPHIIESDVSDPDATRELMKQIKGEAAHLDVIVSNVAFAKVVTDVSDLKKSALDLSLSYSVWPLVELIQAAHDVFGSYPRYVVAISSSGGEVCYEGYDLVGVSKAMLEALCRYLAVRLKRYGVRVNALRPGLMDTASARATFGDEVIDSIQKQMAELFLAPESAAKACVALCSGLLDSVTGQVITVDEGWSLVSPITYITGRGLPGAFPKSKENDL